MTGENPRPNPYKPDSWVDGYALMSLKLHPVMDEHDRGRAGRDQTLGRLVIRGSGVLGGLALHAIGRPEPEHVDFYAGAVAALDGAFERIFSTCGP